MRTQYIQPIESLESRLLMSAAASAVIGLASTTGTGASAVYNYSLTLSNTGTTTLGTFWFSWVPGEDFLATVPLTEASPAGWGNAAGTSSTPAITGSGNSADGSAIQWVAQSSSAALAPGQSLSGFTFSTHDSPADLAGDSPSHPSEPVLTSFVYQGVPFSGTGFEFTVTNNTTSSTGTTGTTTTTSSSLAPTIEKSTLPSTIVTGGTAKGSVIVSLTNQSSATVKGSANVEIFATTDGAIDGSAVPLATISHRVNLAAGKSGPVTIPIKSIPATLPAGPYSLVAQVTDPSGHSSASAADSSLIASAPIVMLSGSFTRLSLPASIAAGSATDGVASLKFDNTGNIASRGSTTVAFLLSADGAVDNSATPIESFNKTLRILPDKARPLSFRLTRIPSVAPGSYFVVARLTDSMGDVTTAVSSVAVNVVSAAIASKPTTSTH